MSKHALTLPSPLRCSSGPGAPTGYGHPLASEPVSVVARDALEPQALPIGERVEDRYLLVSVLGAGGMGVVYLAEDARLRRKVALKFLHSTAGQGARQRFQREAQILAEAVHRHVIGVYDIGEYRGRPYFVMEYVDGMTLAQYLAGFEGGLPVDVALGFGMQVCEAVDRVHALGMIHRDIKPGNVMITRDNEALLMDFGLAQETGGRIDGVVSGTPQYLAPEDARGAPLDGEDARRSDIYALGVTLYELLAGKPPFDDADPMKVLRSQLVDVPRPLSELRPDVPASIQRIVMRALEKDPAHRAASCTELIEGLRSARVDAGVGPVERQATPPSSREPLR